MSLPLPTLIEIGSREEVQNAVGDLYQSFQQQVDLRKPICSQSGQCCRFRDYGHRLYITTIELALFAASLPKDHFFNPAAPEQGACPFQQDNLCSVHTIRPFGCRIFFCDPSATDWQQSQYELFHARLKDLHHHLNIPYTYIEWVSALALLNLPRSAHATNNKPLTTNDKQHLSLPQLPF